MKNQYIGGNCLKRGRLEYFADFMNVIVVSRFFFDSFQFEFWVEAKHTQACASIFRLWFDNIFWHVFSEVEVAALHRLIYNELLVQLL